MANWNYPLYDVRRIATLNELIDRRAAESAGNAAFAWTRSGQRVEKSYGELKQEVMALGKALGEMGANGTKVVIFGENSYYWLLSFFAVTYTANVAVPVDKELPVEDIVWMVKNSGCTHMITSEQYCDIAETVCRETGLRMINMKDIPRLVFERKEASGSDTEAVRQPDVSEDTLAAIIYTSGTTGMSKGVMLSHGNLALDACSACRNYRLHGDTMLLLPLHHSFGLVAGVLMTLVYGYTVYINTSLKAISRDFPVAKPQNLFLVPLFVEMFYRNIWNTAEKSGKAGMLRNMVKVSNCLLKCGIDLRRKLFRSVIDGFGGNLDTIVSGGAPLSEKYIKGFRELGINLLCGYGITECSPVVSVNRNQFYKDGSVGPALDECTVRIDAENENGMGEVCVKGPIVMQGYYGMQEATDEAVVDGWFHTGDIGYLDQDGFIYITGRKKNLIILSNGENVSPEELEGMFSGIPLVKEIVVYEDGHRIIAEVYPDKQYAEEKKVMSIKEELEKKVAEINRGLPKFKQISAVRVRDAEFEKTATKKIKRSSVGGNK